MSFFITPTVEDMLQVREALRQERAANRDLSRRLWAAKAESTRFQGFVAAHREISKRYLVEIDGVRRRCWDLADENDRLRAENGILDAENDQLRAAELQLQHGTYF